MTDNDQNMVYGINPVLQAVESSQRKCHKIIVEKGKANPRVQAIIDIARAAGIKLEFLPRAVFYKSYGGCVHQGVVAYFSQKAVLTLEEIVEMSLRQTPQPVLAALDGVQDPQNVGAIIRSAEALGIQGLILPKHRAAPLNETVAKCSAGAIENLPIAQVANISQALETLKKSGFWIVGVDMDGENPCYRHRFDTPIVLLIGGEGKGLRGLLKRDCDFTVSIPMQGRVGSLNVAAASAILFYEVLRQKAG